MLVIKNQKHFDDVVAFARALGLYDQDPGRPDHRPLKQALDRLERFARTGPDGQPTVRVVLTPDLAPHSFGFSVEAAVDGDWEVTLMGGLIFHGAHDGFGDGSLPTCSVSLSPVFGWSLHT